LLNRNISFKKPPLHKYTKRLVLAQIETESPQNKKACLCWCLVATCEAHQTPYKNGFFVADL